jgi:hypothetical protein
MPGLKPTASDMINLYKSYLLCKKYFNHILTIFFKKQYNLYLLYINNINNGAYYRLWNLVNSGLSLAIGFIPGILCSLKMVRLYRNMSELRV